MNRLYLFLRKSWPLAGLFLLPFLPTAAYFPLALPIGGILVVWLAWGNYRAPVSDANSAHPFRPTLSGIGFGLVLISLLLSGVIVLFEKGPSAISTGFPILILSVGLYFLLSWKFGNAALPEKQSGEAQSGESRFSKAQSGESRFSEAQSGESRFSEAQFRELRWLAMGMVIFWTLWVAFQATGNSFAQLTALLSYTDGFGNTSQIAMYAAMAGLIALSFSNQKVWQWIMVCGLLLVLGYLLDSKLLLGTAALGILSQLLSGQSLKLRRWVTVGLALGTVLAVVLLQPDFLAGRGQTLAVAWQGMDWQLPFGVGPGGLENTFNQLFFTGQIENQIGEIGPIAFNDYLQALVEIGPLGCIGLLLISFNVLRGARPMLALSLIGITAVMFPLQYLESAVLWVLVVLALENKSPVRFPSLRKVRIVLPVLVSTALLFLFYQGTLNLLLSRADQQIKIGQQIRAEEQIKADQQIRTDQQIKADQQIKTDQQIRADQQIQADQIREGLRRYTQLEPYFIWIPEFYLKWGQHLQAAGRQDEALEKFRISAGITPSYTALTHLADACFSKELYGEAIQRYEQAHLLRPKRLYPRYRKVFTLLQLGMEEEAIKLANELVVEFAQPHDPLQAAMIAELKEKVLSVGF